MTNIIKYRANIVFFIYLIILSLLGLIFIAFLYFEEDSNLSLTLVITLNIVIFAFIYLIFRYIKKSIIIFDETGIYYGYKKKTIKYEEIKILLYNKFSWKKFFNTPKNELGFLNILRVITSTAYLDIPINYKMLLKVISMFHLQVEFIDNFNNKITNID